MHPSAPPGRSLPVLAIIGLLTMVAMLAYGFANGYFAAQVYAIGSIAWGQVAFVDLYVGRFLFAAWMIWRGGPRPATAAWIVALLILGNLVACIYILWALRHGESDRFWHGRRSEA